MTNPWRNRILTAFKGSNITSSAGAREPLANAQAGNLIVALAADRDA